MALLEILMNPSASGITVVDLEQNKDIETEIIVITKIDKIMINKNVTLENVLIDERSRTDDVL